MYADVARPSFQATDRLWLTGYRVLNALQVFFSVTLLLAILPGSVTAQRPVAGVVTDGATSAPLAGVYVVLESQVDGRAVTAALTNEAGRFLLSGEVGQIYRVRAERVGLGTEVTGWFTLQDDASPLRIALRDRAVELEGLDVRASVRTCRLDPGEAVTVQRWWDEIRKALQVTAFGEASGVGQLRFQRFERDWSANLRALRYERDLPTDSTPSRPFLSQSAETLSEEGFVQGPEGDRIFVAPDAEVLFSEAFLADHCLRFADEEESEVLEGRVSTGSLRLAVDPTREHPSDIRGLLTVDTLSGELRSFDFSYVNLPPEFPRTQAGGHLEFAYLATGAWIVSNWWVRLPRIDYRWGEGDRRGAVPLITGYLDQGGRTLDSQGRPLSFEGSGDRATLMGVVYDSLSGHLLPDARVSVVGTRYSTRTDSTGRFTIPGVPTGLRALTFNHVELNRMGLPSPVFAVEVGSNMPDGITLATPGFASSSRLICPDGDGTPSTVLTGRVLERKGTGGLPSAEVRARWVEVGRSMLKEGQAGSDGRYALCDLPARLPVSLSVRTDSASWRDAGIAELDAGRITVRELSPGAEARAIVRGTVRADGEGPALAGARIWILSVTGDTVGRARADSTGVFHLSVPPGVGYRAVASAEGYLREASSAFILDGAESLDVTFQLIPDRDVLTMKIEGIVVEVEARNRAVAKRLLRQFGQNEITMGRRWIGVATLDSMPSTGEADPGVAIQRQGVPGVWVDEAAKHGKNALLCVRQKPRECSLIILNGIQVDLQTALLIDYRELEGIAVLRPEDATTFFGTQGGGGAVVLWTRGSGR